MHQHSTQRSEHVLPVVESGRAAVPVYDCHVILSPPDEHGVIRARATSLAGITGEGRTEREALRRVVDAFKAELVKHTQSGTPIPWRIPPEDPSPAEQQRWIPVHL